METPEYLGERSFAQSVRRMCEAELPDDIRSKVEFGVPLAKEDFVRWQKILARNEMLIGHWPTAYGGQGWSTKKVYVFHLELGRAGAPWLIPFGVNYVGPVIHTFGSEAQKAKYLPPISSADVFWCQGFSEPNAGSDLARLKTTAERAGDHYVVNGSKIWTTMAHWADMMFCLVRTDRAAKPQRGISFLLIDLKTPGIKIRPIRTIDGHHHVNEVFFSDVKVPAENLVGEENRGWDYAKFLLGNERYLAADIGKIGRYLERIQRAARSVPVRVERPDIRRRFLDLRVDLLALEWTAARLLACEAQDVGASSDTSMLKLRGAELVQRASELAIDALGVHALATGSDQASLATSDIVYGGMAFEYLFNRAPTIWGGSNEVQRNIIAKRVLELS